MDVEPVEKNKPLQSPRFRELIVQSGDPLGFLKRRLESVVALDSIKDVTKSLDDSGKYRLDIMEAMLCLLDVIAESPYPDQLKEAFKNTIADNPEKEKDNTQPQ